MRVIIAGSRNIIDEPRVISFIRQSKFKITKVVCGLARGPDTIGRNWAIQNNIDVKYYPANWSKYKKAAGPIRNKEMGDYADALIAIWDGKSPGTKHMIEYMRKLNKPYEVYIVKAEYEFRISETERSNIKDFL